MPKGMHIFNFFFMCMPSTKNYNVFGEDIYVLCTPQCNDIDKQFVSNLLIDPLYG